MPSPVAHILSGLAVYVAGTRPDSRSRFIGGVTLLGSIVPDFDFLPGILIGDMGAFHHGISHSLVFSALFGALVFLVAAHIDRTIALRASLLSGIAYAVHVMLDFVGVYGNSRGVPLLWPLIDEKFGYALSLFGHFHWSDIRHGPGAIIRKENVLPVIREIVVVGTVVVALLARERNLKSIFSVAKNK
jgi:hypothetical protein